MEMGTMYIPYFSGTLIGPSRGPRSNSSPDSAIRYQPELQWRHPRYAEAPALCDSVRPTVAKKLPDSFTLQLLKDPRIMKITFPVRTQFGTEEKPLEEQWRMVTIRAYRKISVPEDKWIEAVVEALQPIAMRWNENQEEALKYGPFYVDPSIVTDDHLRYTQRTYQDSEFIETPKDIEDNIRTGLSGGAKMGIPALNHYNYLVTLLEAHSALLCEANIGIHCTGGGFVSNPIQVTKYALRKDPVAMDEKGLETFLRGLGTLQQEPIVVPPVVATTIRWLQDHLG